MLEAIEVIVFSISLVLQCFCLAVILAETADVLRSFMWDEDFIVYSLSTDALVSNAVKRNAYKTALELRSKFPEIKHQNEKSIILQRVLDIILIDPELSIETIEYCFDLAYNEETQISILDFLNKCCRLRNKLIMEAD